MPSRDSRALELEPPELETTLEPPFFDDLPALPPGFDAADDGRLDAPELEVDDAERQVLFGELVWSEIK